MIGDFAVGDKSTRSSTDFFATKSGYDSAFDKTRDLIEKQRDIELTGCSISSLQNGSGRQFTTDEIAYLRGKGVPYF